MTSLYNFTQEDLKKLLSNRFVVLIGDSVMRTMYKDLIVMLQFGRKLTTGECRSKGEAKFHNDVLIEGGKMTNGKDYREVRQYVSNQHLIRFYFVTRVYNGYVETIFADFYKSLKPDIVIVNSCLWDISRYGVKSMESYKVNLQKFCCNLKRLLSPHTAIIWTTTLPVSSQIRGGFLSQGTGFLTEILRLDVLVANHFSFQVVKRFGFGVLDMNYLFRQKLHLMARDGVHWMSDAHRDITNILMEYICRALNVVVPNRCRVDRLLRYRQPSHNESLMSFEEPKSFCRADNETEMSYCDGLYDEAPYNDVNSCADNDWAADSFNEDSVVEWPKRNYLSPDKNANFLQPSTGKLQHGPGGSSTPNVSHTRLRPTDQYSTGWSSQSLNISSRNVKSNSSDQRRYLSIQIPGNKIYSADDSNVSFKESHEEGNEEEFPEIVQKAELVWSKNKCEYVQDQHEYTQPLSNSYSKFRKNWKPYEAGEILRTQKSSMQNCSRARRAFAGSFNNTGTERRWKRFHQPYYGHGSLLQNQGTYCTRLIPQLQSIATALDHAVQRSIYHHRLQPY